MSAVGVRAFVDRYLAFFTTPVLVLVIVGVWQLYIEVTGVSHFVLPAPKDVLTALGTQITDPHI